MKRGIYMSSKVKHASHWRMLRDELGEPIISTWIDNDGPGESADLAIFADVWKRCIMEASTCEVLIVYRKGDDDLDGSWAEIGAALAADTPVYAVGIEKLTHPGVTHFTTIELAIDAARALRKAA